MNKQRGMHESSKQTLSDGDDSLQVGNKRGDPIDRTMIFGLTGKQTFDSSEKSSKGKFRAWFRKNVLGTKHDKTSTFKGKKKEYPGLVVIDPKDNSNNDRKRGKDELSGILSSMSVADIRKTFGSRDDISGESITSCSSGTREVPKEQIDFRNRLELYKARSSAYKKKNLVKPEKMKKESSFTLLSFSSSHSSDSSSLESCSDEDLTDDNLLDTIGRLVMGEREPIQTIKEMAVMVPKAPVVQKNRPLSPRPVANHHNTPSKSSAPKITQLFKSGGNIPIGKTGNFSLSSENQAPGSPKGGFSVLVVPTSAL